MPSDTVFVADMYPYFLYFLMGLNKKPFSIPQHYLPL